MGAAESNKNKMWTLHALASGHADGRLTLSQGVLNVFERLDISGSWDQISIVQILGEFGTRAPNKIRKLIEQCATRESTQTEEGLAEATHHALRMTAPHQAAVNLPNSAVHTSTETASSQNSGSSSSSSSSSSSGSSSSSSSSDEASDQAAGGAKVAAEVQVRAEEAAAVALSTSNLTDVRRRCSKLSEPANKRSKCQHGRQQRICKECGCSGIEAVHDGTAVATEAPAAVLEDATAANTTVAEAKGQAALKKTLALEEEPTNMASDHLSPKRRSKRQTPETVPSDLPSASPLQGPLTSAFIGICVNDRPHNFKTIDGPGGKYEECSICKERGVAPPTASAQEQDMFKCFVCLEEKCDVIVSACQHPICRECCVSFTKRLHRESKHYQTGICSQHVKRPNASDPAIKQATLEELKTALEENNLSTVRNLFGSPKTVKALAMSRMVYKEVMSASLRVAFLESLQPEQREQFELVMPAEQREQFELVMSALEQIPMNATMELTPDVQTWLLSRQ